MNLKIVQLVMLVNEDDATEMHDYYAEVLLNDSEALTAHVETRDLTPEEIKQYEKYMVDEGNENEVRPDGPDRGDFGGLIGQQPY